VGVPEEGEKKEGDLGGAYWGLSGATRRTEGTLPE